MKKLRITAGIVCIILVFSIQAGAQHRCTAAVDVTSSGYAFTIPCVVVGSTADGAHDSTRLEFKLDNAYPFGVMEFTGPVRNAPGANAAAPVAKTGCVYSTSAPFAASARTIKAGSPPVSWPGGAIARGARRQGGDGDLKRGVSWPEPRFQDNGNGTVTDHLTGLIWLKKADCIEFYHGDPAEYNSRAWEDAVSAVNNLGAGYCGLEDGSSAGEWRLPNRFELESLLHLGFHSPPLSDTSGTGHWKENDPFTGVETYSYWSSTTVVFTPSYAWFVHMGNGLVNGDGKSVLLHAWAVRGGQ
ncbi:MAG: DUF1566 domain-containing protein [Desulfobacterales bacterium]|nr:DUF1566 domain-containing protein [Desulfobacterales bacterium]